MNEVPQKCVESDHLLKVGCLALHTQERASTHSFLDQNSEQRQINYLLNAAHFRSQVAGEGVSLLLTSDKAFSVS